MGAKTWMLVYADEDAREALSRGSAFDRERTLQLARSLFPGEKLEPLGDGDLMYTCPPDNEIHIGCFPGVSVVAAKEFGIDYPSRLPVNYIKAGGAGTVYLHAMHSVVDWFAFAQWNGGRLVRSLSLSPDHGVIENIGEPLPFEEPYWAGEYSVGDEEEEDGEDSYPFPFHPLDLGEAALAALFGYELEGSSAAPATLFAPESVPLMRCARSRSWWKLW